MGINYPVGLAQQLELPILMPTPKNKRPPTEAALLLGRIARPVVTTQHLVPAAFVTVLYLKRCTPSPKFLIV
jgi:hypothetical protein